MLTLRSRTVWHLVDSVTPPIIRHRETPCSHQSNVSGDGESQASKKHHRCVKAHICASEPKETHLCAIIFFSFYANQHFIMPVLFYISNTVHHHAPQSPTTEGE